MNKEIRTIKAVDRVLLLENLLDNATGRIKELEECLSDLIDDLECRDFDDVDFGRGFQEAGWLKRMKELLKNGT